MTGGHVHVRDGEEPPPSKFDPRIRDLGRDGSGRSLVEPQISAADARQIGERYGQRSRAWLAYADALDGKQAAPSGPAAARSAQGEVLRPVVDLVNGEGEAIRARDVTAKLREQGHDLSGDSVTAALHYAAKKRRPPLLESPGRGLYAPLHRS